MLTHSLAVLCLALPCLRMCDSSQATNSTLPSSVQCFSSVASQAQQQEFHIDKDNASWLQEELLDARQKQGNDANSFHKQLTVWCSFKLVRFGCLRPPKHKSCVCKEAQIHSTGDARSSLYTSVDMCTSQQHKCVPGAGYSGKYCVMRTSIT